MAYFERERRELVNLNYAEPVRSPLSSASPESLAYSHYFAELIDACAADADVDERLFRLGCSVLDALSTGTAGDALARYFECWLLTTPGRVSIEPLALSWCARVRRRDASGDARRGRTLGASARVLRELELKHQALITSHLEKELKSIRVMNELRRLPEQ